MSLMNLCYRRNANLSCLLQQVEWDAAVYALLLTAVLLHVFQGLKPCCPVVPENLFSCFSILNSYFLQLLLLSLVKESHLVVHGCGAVAKFQEIKKYYVDGAIRATLFLSN